MRSDKLHDHYLPAEVECGDQTVASPATSKRTRSRLSTLDFGAARRMSSIDDRFAALTSLYNAQAESLFQDARDHRAKRTFSAIARMHVFWQCSHHGNREVSEKVS